MPPEPPPGPGEEPGLNRGTTTGERVAVVHFPNFLRTAIRMVTRVGRLRPLEPIESRRSMARGTLTVSRRTLLVSGLTSKTRPAAPRKMIVLLTRLALNARPRKTSVCPALTRVGDT